MYSS
jgi:hypothetical protein